MRCRSSGWRFAPRRCSSSTRARASDSFNKSLRMVSGSFVAARQPQRFAFFFFLADFFADFLAAFFGPGFLPPFLDFAAAFFFGAAFLTALLAAFFTLLTA